MSKEVWYQKWESEYLGTGDERKAFQAWFDAGLAERYIDTADVSETDLLDTYRDTQAWTDTFLDWAFVMESDYRIEQYTEENQ